MEIPRVVGFGRAVVGAACGSALALGLAVLRRRRT